MTDGLTLSECSSCFKNKASHRELYSISCTKSQWERIWKRMYVCITESLNCIAEINANCKSAYLQFHLYFSKIKFKNKDREKPMWIWVRQRFLGWHKKQGLKRKAVPEAHHTKHVYTVHFITWQNWRVYIKQRPGLWIIGLWIENKIRI